MAGHPGALLDPSGPHCCSEAYLRVRWEHSLVWQTKEFGLNGAILSLRGSGVVIQSCTWECDLDEERDGKKVQVWRLL